MHLFDNSNQYYRIYYRFSSYRKIVFATLRKGVPLRETIITKFPYNFKDNDRPCSLSIEIGNVCDLKCQYCKVPLFSRKREFMSDEVFESLIDNVSDFAVNRIRIGGAEPTLHPKFAHYAGELSRHTKFLSIVTNGQWKTDDILEALVRFLDLIEVSVDAGGKEVYENSRKGAKYELLMDNIKKLKKMQANSGRKSLINIRLMFRPSTRHSVNNEIRYLNQYCDCIMPQFLCKVPESNYEEDLYIPKQAVTEDYPRCTLPFKDMMIMADGVVPYCQITGSTIKREQIVAGNIKEMKISDIWHNEVRKLRDEHRSRHFNTCVSAYCRGCSGR